MIDKRFREKVYEIISKVPFGRAITYGDVAALAGNAYAARVVGGIAHYGDANLPWHRLVNRFGGLAAGFPGGREIQQVLLFAEGFNCIDFKVVGFKELRWNPII